MSFIQEVPVRIVGFDEAELEKTITYVKKFADQKLTLADAHGLALMKANHISNCWSTDRRLAVTGATLIC